MMKHADSMDLITMQSSTAYNSFLMTPMNHDVDEDFSFATSAAATSSSSLSAALPTSHSMPNLSNYAYEDHTLLNVTMFSTGPSSPMGVKYETDESNNGDLETLSSSSTDDLLNANTPPMYAMDGIFSPREDYPTASSSSAAGTTSASSNTHNMYNHYQQKQQQQPQHHFNIPTINVQQSWEGNNSSSNNGSNNGSNSVSNPSSARESHRPPTPTSVPRPRSAGSSYRSNFASSMPSSFSFHPGHQRSLTVPNGVGPQVNAGSGVRAPLGRPSKASYAKTISMRRSQPPPALQMPTYNNDGPTSNAPFVVPLDTLRPPTPQSSSHVTSPLSAHGLQHQQDSYSPGSSSSPVNQQSFFGGGNRMQQQQQQQQQPLTNNMGNLLLKAEDPMAHSGHGVEDDPPALDSLSDTPTVSPSASNIPLVISPTHSRDDFQLPLSSWPVIEEEEPLAVQKLEKLQTSKCCSRGCLARLTDEMILPFLKDVQRMDKRLRELYILILLQQCREHGPQVSRKKQTRQRQRDKYNYNISPVGFICHDAFIQLFGVTKGYLDALQSYLRAQNSVIPRVHGNWKSGASDERHSLLKNRKRRAFPLDPSAKQMNDHALISPSSSDLQQFPQQQQPLQLQQFVHLQQLQPVSMQQSVVLDEPSSSYLPM